MTIALLLIFGLALGSFLSVVLSRLELTELPTKARGQSRKRRRKTEARAALAGRSRCDHCGKTIHWYDNVPVLSYLWLRGNCRHCGKHISGYHPILELSSGLFLVAAYLAFGLSAQFLVAAVFGLLMLLIFAFDLKHQLIPNVVVIPAIGLALALLVYQFGIFRDTGGLGPGLMGISPMGYLLGGVVAGGFFTLLSLLSGGRWIGGGDIKLGFLMGLLLGWPYALVALVLAYLIGAFYAVILLASRQANLKTLVPFGPMLVMGFLITFFYGELIVRWYQGWVI